MMVMVLMVLMVMVMVLMVTRYKTPEIAREAPLGGLQLFRSHRGPSSNLSASL